MKKRLVALLIVLIFAIVIPIISYYQLIGCTQYFGLSSEIIYSRFSIVVILGPLITIPFSILGFYVITSGRLAPEEVQRKINKFVIYAFAFIFISTIFSSVLYTYYIEHKGYHRCKNIPLGWSPGTSIKLVIDEKLCNKH